MYLLMYIYTFLSISISIPLTCIIFLLILVKNDCLCENIVIKIIEFGFHIMNIIPKRLILYFHL